MYLSRSGFENFLCVPILSHTAPGVTTVNVIPQYSHLTLGLLSISSSFDALVNSFHCKISTDNSIDIMITSQDSFTLSDGFMNRVISYNISYSDSTTGNICSPVATIPTAMCHDRICKHFFEVSSSFCHPSTNITISVVTASMLGSASSDPLTIGISFIIRHHATIIVI